jgi:pimeloyl-ACP methyl ester carboxylesterase
MTKIIGRAIRNLRQPMKVLTCTSLLFLWAVSVHGQVQPSGTQSQSAMEAIRPFKAEVPDRILIDLKQRLAEAKWPDQLPGTSWEYGADIKKVRQLAAYWQNQYDWRAQEARINRFHQYTTEIDGQQIHFICERSPRPNAIPLLLIHGWPGSFLEFLGVIDPLTRPSDINHPAFDVIVPSLPGFGFSGPTTARGWSPQRMAKALIVLMERLGYSRYGIQGGDWGSAIARDMARQAPARVIGLHLNLLYAAPPNREAIAKMSDLEQKRYSWFQREEASFFNLQSSEPQTVAYALTDSPIGWLAWMIAKFQALTDNNGDFLTAVDRDTFLTDVTLYWVTGTVGSAMRIYRENRLSGEQSSHVSRLDTPVAFADFPKEVFTTPLSWIKRTYNVVQYTKMPRGGHFAALEQPDLLVEDVRTFFAKVAHG